jgi:hypothetical protein
MMRLSAVILLGLTLGSVAACQTINDVANTVTGSDSGADAVAPGAPQLSPSGPEGAVSPTAAPINAGLAGMTADRLRAAWGEPTLKRTERGSELWQYGGTGCSLLIYFYAGSGGALIASHAEAVPGGTNVAAVEACAQATGKPSLKPVS